jgi:hypothetical protein
VRIRATGLIATIVACLSLAQWPAHAETGATQPMSQGGTDVAGWRGLPWGQPARHVLGYLDRDALVTRDAIEVAGCYFTSALPIRLQNEEWEAWICEDRRTGAFVAVSLEKGYDDMFFDDRRTTELFDTFVAEFTALYGPAHEYWEHCHNARWHATVQYRWFFPTTTVSLLLRDAPDRWVSIRYEQPNDRPNFGPGVCVSRPRDLRG